MEGNQTPSSLASFPTEHPEIVATSKPFYRSKLFLISVIVLLLLGAGIFGGYMVLGNKQQKSTQKITQNKVPTPKQAITKVTPAGVTADWNTYKNNTYAYEIKYDKTIMPKEMNTAQYSTSEFMNGCMKVYAVPQTVVNTLPEEKNGIPWKQLDDLKSMPIGQSRNCSVLTFTFGADGKAIVDRNDYTRLDSQSIAGSNWYTFSVKNGTSTDVTTHNVLFTEKNNTTYVIEAKTGGSCPATTTEMLSTFRFTR